jgi:type IV secretion system protein VirB1
MTKLLTNPRRETAGKQKTLPSPIVAPQVVRRAVAWSFSLAVAMLPSASRAETLSVPAFLNLAARCGASVAPTTLAAIAKTESNFQTLVVSDNTTHRSRNFESLDGAVAMADSLIRRGHSVDLGLMQINSNNLRWLGYTARDVLDPCKSVSSGALILSHNYVRVRNVANRQIALRHAISQYNTGNTRSGYLNGYVRRVEQAARTLFAGSVQPVSATTVAHVAPQLAQSPLRPAAPSLAPRYSAVRWTFWNGAGTTKTPGSLSRSESFLVF